MEDIKNEIINSVVMQMAVKLDGDGVQMLRNAMIQCMYDVDIIKKETELAPRNIDEINEFYIQKFCLHKKSENLADSSIAQYRRAINNLLLFYNKKCVIDITREDVENYLAYNMSKKWTSSYANTIRMYLRIFFDYMCSCDFIRKDPVHSIKIIKTRNTKQEILTTQEVVEIKDACETLEETALVDFLLSTGVRVSEVANMAVTDVDFNTGIVQVYSVKTKKWREAYLTDEAKKHLADYIMSRTDNKNILFLSVRGKKIQKDTIEKILKRVRNRTKIKKSCTVHTFRRTFATLQFRKGVSLLAVSKLLGHASIETTEKHYLVLANNDIYQEFKKCNV